MDQQDWPGWPEHDPHLDGADTADLGGQHAGFDHFGDDPLAHDPLDEDPFAAGDADASYGAGHEQEAGGAAQEHFGAAGDVYPDDDPFAPGDHDGAIVHDAPDPHHDLQDRDPVDHPVGADPHGDPRVDAGWDDPAFPPALDLHDPPEPIDGHPWSDPQALGSGLDDGPQVERDWRPPPVADLYDYAGEGQPPGTDAWQALLDSDDPATGALARFWGPGG